jgi:hypothetical protein
MLIVALTENRTSVLGDSTADAPFREYLHACATRRRNWRQRRIARHLAPIVTKIGDAA